MQFVFVVLCVERVHALVVRVRIGGYHLEALFCGCGGIVQRLAICFLVRTRLVV